ncbi:hypothetical protein C8R31_102481 [Nitrosospira sp. Nsp2]|nr:hypothetical protein C8R31_102481 [Nitrosospira sp. Nsp2]
MVEPVNVCAVQPLLPCWYRTSGIGDEAGCSFPMPGNENFFPILDPVEQGAKLVRGFEGPISRIFSPITLDYEASLTLRYVNGGIDKLSILYFSP